MGSGSNSHNDGGSSPRNGSGPSFHMESGPSSHVGTESSSHMGSGSNSQNDSGSSPHNGSEPSFHMESGPSSHADTESSSSSHMASIVNFTPFPFATQFLGAYEENLRKLLANLTSASDTIFPEAELEVYFTFETQGYIQTPGWDGVTTYPARMDSWVRVGVPRNHQVMISVVSLVLQAYDPLCRHDSVSLFLGDHPAHETLVWKVCGIRPKAALYQTDSFLVYFVSDVAFAYAGFRLAFSFHNDSFLPEQLPDGTWNCSVPYFGEFRQHFPCDVKPQCAAGEDEVDCPYTSDFCGPGLLLINGRCYIYVETEQETSWNEASDTCRNQGARLADLNTPSEWREVSNMLRLFDFVRVYIGLKSAGSNLPLLYRYVWQWTDQSIAYFLNIVSLNNRDSCAFLARELDVIKAKSMYCDVQQQANILCEMGDKNVDLPGDTSSPGTTRLSVQTSTDWNSEAAAYVVCLDGHVTHTFLSCDSQSACWAGTFGLASQCQAPVTPLPPSFACTNGIEHVPYTLVCDHRIDCRDASDEEFCVFPPCALDDPFECGNQQCVSREEQCDGMTQCVNGADEARCFPFQYFKSTLPPPAIVDLDGRGEYQIRPLNNSTLPCPDTHFLCPGEGYCMPVYVRCNGVYDCPGHEDELDCESYTCPGFYRCRGSRICLHASHVCDDLFQCPQQDDELFCELSCPEGCVCYGQSFICHSRFTVDVYLDIKFLDAAGTGLTFLDVANNTMLIHLGLSRCGLTRIDNVNLPNLRSLDISFNSISEITLHHLDFFPQLDSLSLAGNPLSAFFPSGDSHQGLSPLKLLDLSQILIPVLNVSLFSFFPNLQTLNLSSSKVEAVAGEGFKSLEELRTLDLRGCPMTTFPRNVFKGLENLDTVYADNYKLCCPVTLPDDFNPLRCHAPSDEISSCDALLRSDIYRVLLFLFAVLAVFGNVGSFIYRVFFESVANSLGFGAFVIHLCASDFLMGVYLAMIGVADQVYQGTYLWNDVEWKNSAGCKIAGFLSLLSSEVSAFIICLITLDRFLVLRFPFSQVHFRKRSAHVVCAIAWVVGVILAATPLFPFASHWQFYSQTGICIPLPITRSEFPGHDYSFGILIVLNFVLFLFIASGQIFIYWSVRTNSISADDSSKKSKDLTIARRLITIAMSDFLCWFPIGLLGLMASYGTAVPGEVNVAMAIIALPVNSALNPFLYTLNVIMERRRRLRELRLQKSLASRSELRTKGTDVACRCYDSRGSKEDAMTFIHTLITTGTLSMDNIINSLKKKFPGDGDSIDSASA